MKKILSVNEAAQVLGISRTLTYDLIRTGRLRAVRLGNRTMILPEDIDTFLADLPTWGH